MLAQPAPPVDEPSKEIITFNYKDASPFTKAQIEAKFGLEPDPMHEVEAQKELVDHAADMTNRLDQTVDAQGNPIDLGMGTGAEEDAEMLPVEQGAGDMMPAMV